MKVDFKGGKQLEAALKQLDITTARKRGLAGRALDVAAVPIRDAWANGVDIESGDLKRSIKIGNRAQTRGTRAFRRGAGQDIVERYVGIDESEDVDGRLAIYSVIEEFGDENQPANPAGRNAFENKKHEAMDRIADALWSEIGKVAAKEGRKAKR